MRRMWKVVVDFLTRYGQYGAGMASVCGNFEAPIPPELQK